MKKINILSIVYLAVMVVFAVSANGQGRSLSGDVSPVKPGSMIANLGIGVGVDYKNDNGASFGTKIAVERGIWQAGPGVITLGGEIGGSFSNAGYDGNYNNYKSRTFVMAGRSAWHFGWNVPGLDTYGGFSAGIGFHHFEYKSDINVSDNEVLPVFGAFIGASYFVSPSFGFNAEAGSDITNFQIGIILKMQ